MRKWPLILSSMICALALSGCAMNGAAVKPGSTAPCPVLLPPPAALMQPSNAAPKVRAELFAPRPSATPR